MILTIIRYNYTESDKIFNEEIMKIFNIINFESFKFPATCNKADNRTKKIFIEMSYNKLNLALKL